MTLTLAQANQIISAALENSKQSGYKPMGMVVLDEAGNLKAFAREDGASMFRFDVALGKAWGAVGMGASSRVLGQRAKDNPNFFVSLAATAQSDIFANGPLMHALACSPATCSPRWPSTRRATSSTTWRNRHWGRARSTAISRCSGCR